MIFFLVSGLLFAQPVLQPSIGISSLPNDTDSTCNPPFYFGSFDASGLQAGDTAYDFTLYNHNSDSLNLSTALGNGTPVLLVAGSYTCPVFRNKIQDINNVVQTYGSMLQVYVIYTIEAHPDSDTSVYFGYVNPTSQNIQAGILYGEARTYGERKSIAQDLLDSMTILAPLFIDGPCDNWWLNYGPAPNNSYLIDTNGIIFSKHGWFDRYPEDIFCDIDSLLGINSGQCGSSTGNGTFTFNLLSNDTVFGETGNTLTIDGELVNNSSQDLPIYVRRIQNNLAPGWASALCIDVCYSTVTDSVVFLLPANTTQSFHFYFFTSANDDTSHARVGFRNENNTSNMFLYNFYGITGSFAGINETGNEKYSFTVSPNPVENQLTVSGNQQAQEIFEIIDVFGRSILHRQPAANGRQQSEINVSHLSPGIYFLKANNSIAKFVKQ
jgi:hypothetical protein